MLDRPHFQELASILSGTCYPLRCCLLSRLLSKRESSTNFTRRPLSVSRNQGSKLFRLTGISSQILDSSARRILFHRLDAVFNRRCRSAQFTPSEYFAVSRFQNEIVLSRRRFSPLVSAIDRCVHFHRCNSSLRAAPLLKRELPQYGARLFFGR